MCRGGPTGRVAALGVAGPARPRRGRGSFGLVRIGLGTAVLCLVAGRSVAGSPSAAPPANWGVIVEDDWYGGRYANLSDGYRNSTRVLEVLVRRGWPADHVLLLRDDLDPRSLRRALEWLAARVHPGDTALLYVAGEYEFFARDLRWAQTVPPLWRRIPTSRRVAIVETCFAERLALALRDVPGLVLPAVGANEWDLWGTRGAGPLIQGGAFTYYLAMALGRQPQDAPLGFGAAFDQAVAETQAYFRNVVVHSPGALAVFHARGSFPERLPRFPNPHLVRAGGDGSATVGGTAPQP